MEQINTLFENLLNLGMGVGAAVAAGLFLRSRLPAVRRALITERVKGYADEIRTDPLGSLIVLKKGTGGGKRIMVAAHMDEIGVVVAYIDKKGFVRFGRLGGLSPLTVLGRRVRFANGTIGVIAGPCSVETEEQILTSAKAVKAAGATALRGGAFKPRSHPYAFQGLGSEGIALLKEARAATGLPVVTEVMSSEEAEWVAPHIDILQVGARNMQNFSLLRTLGGLDRPVLLKRGMCATIEEWLQAAEYILAGGNERVILCERGIRSFDKNTRNTLDLSVVPLLKSMTINPARLLGLPSGRLEKDAPADLALIAHAATAQ